MKRIIKKTLKWVIIAAIVGVGGYLLFTKVIKKKNLRWLWSLRKRSAFRLLRRP